MCWAPISVLVVASVCPCAAPTWSVRLDQRLPLRLRLGLVAAVCSSAAVSAIQIELRLDVLAQAMRLVVIADA